MKISVWGGLFAPKGTPRRVIAKLNSAAVSDTLLAVNFHRNRILNRSFDRFLCAFGLVLGFIAK